eukprot:2640699-Amphidinium_carterae.1
MVIPRFSVPILVLKFYALFSTGKFVGLTPHIDCWIIVIPSVVMFSRPESRGGKNPSQGHGSLSSFRVNS